MPKQILDQASGQVFTVEEVGPGEFQSVFPERLAAQSSLHANEQDAWDWIEEVRGDEVTAQIAKGFGVAI